MSTRKLYEAFRAAPARSQAALAGYDLPDVVWRESLRCGQTLTGFRPPLRTPANPRKTSAARRFGTRAMKVRNSLKSLRGRHRDNRLVRRKGRLYVINKTQRRFKARQG